MPAHITCAHRPAPEWGEPALAALGPLGPSELRVYSAPSVRRRRAKTTLRASELRVYRLAHATGQALAALAPRVLSAPKLARGQRYMQATDRQRFLVGRAALRVLLGQLTGQAPGAVGFALSATHKPHLAHPPGCTSACRIPATGRCWR